MSEAGAVNVLVAYASRHGSTAEIAEAIATVLRECGLSADCVEAGEARSLGSYDAIVLGSAVYMKRWRREARHFLRSHRRELAELPFWVFSSGPVGEPSEEADAWAEPKHTIHTAEELGARDHAVFGGRVPDEGFAARSMAENTPPEYRDRRDWDAIRAWAESIARELETAA
jgi:menaquinone-dependent protoporphyrinogen oxidase